MIILPKQKLLQITLLFATAFAFLAVSAGRVEAGSQICGQQCFSNSDCIPSGANSALTDCKTANGQNPSPTNPGRCEARGCPYGGTLYGVNCDCAAAVRSCGQRCGVGNDGTSYPLCGDGISSCTYVYGPSCQLGSFNNWITYCVPVNRPGYGRPKCVDRDQYNSYFSGPGNQTFWSNPDVSIPQACQWCGNGIIDPGETCDASVQNGVPGSGCQANCIMAPVVLPNGLSGRHELVAGAGKQGINNPLTIKTDNVDLDGAFNLDTFKIWIANKPITPGTQINVAAYGVVKYNGGNLQLVPNGRAATAYALGSSRVICTKNSTTQDICDLVVPSSLSGANAYVRPIAISPITNGYSVTWEVGFLTGFNGDVGLYSAATDFFGGDSGWKAIQAWRVDLVPPATSATLALESSTTFAITYMHNETLTKVVSTDKQCEGTVSSTQSVTLSNSTSGGTPITFSSGTTKRFCFNGNPVTQAQFKVGATNQYSLTERYALSAPLNLANTTIDFTFSAKDEACNVGISPVERLRLISPWLMTSGGDTFSRNGFSPNPLQDIANINNPAIDEGLTPIASAKPPLKMSLLDTKMPYLSTYNYIDNVGSAVARASQSQFALKPYNDTNGKPRASTGFDNWYDFIDSRVNQNIPRARIKDIAGSTNSYGVQAITPTLLSSIPALGVTANGVSGTNVEDRVLALRFAGSLTLTNISCDSKVIFMVPGNLTINPEFELTEITTGPTRIAVVPSNMNGCLFVVGGTTIIGTGKLKGTASTTQAAYDLIKAFIITDSFQVLPDSIAQNGLQIRGGVITNQANVFRRDIGVVINQLAPSEVFRYDGGRYIYIYGNILTDVVDFSVKEKPFIESAQ